jgi:hypothetical protein
MVACHAGVFPDQCTRKVRAPRRRVAGNTRPPRGEDQCHRDESPGSASADRAGETGKLYPEQGQIGGRNRGPTTPGRRRVAKPSGRPHETVGDHRPRWMTVAAAKAAVQNSAYRPPSWHTAYELLFIPADACADPTDKGSASYAPGSCKWRRSLGRVSPTHLVRVRRPSVFVRCNARRSTARPRSILGPRVHAAAIRPVRTVVCTRQGRRWQDSRLPPGCWRR